MDAKILRQSVNYLSFRNPQTNEAILMTRNDAGVFDNHITSRGDTVIGNNAEKRAIHDRLRPTYLWMTSKDTLIREFFYHDEAVQEWLKAHFRGDKAKSITIRILDDDGLRIVKA